ncbi:hypothetical protein KGF36_11790 [Clostridioides sp. ZZV14-6009]|uniref:hypothetical protein n=1 Tax=Clostridioides sp. ZZV14-6009 TaxID=2811487 RepID=UPI001D1260CE|nr:hypothetical protein [Clostridioides sp. ZZV14-6009]
MDYFKVNKYSSIDENILYISSNILEILSSGNKSLEKIIENYQRKYSSDLSLNMETNIYLAILFLFETGKINLKNKKIRLDVEKIDFK